MLVNYKSGNSTQGLRNQIAELTREVEALKAENIALRTASPDGQANAKILQEYQAYREHVKRCVDGLAAAADRINERAIAMDKAQRS